MGKLLILTQKYLNLIRYCTLQLAVLLLRAGCPRVSTGSDTWVSGRTRVCLSVDHVGHHAGTVGRDGGGLENGSRVPVGTLFLVTKFVVVGPEPAAAEPTGVGLLTCHGNKEINIKHQTNKEHNTHQYEYACVCSTLTCRREFSRRWDTPFFPLDFPCLHLILMIANTCTFAFEPEIGFNERQLIK